MSQQYGSTRQHRNERQLETCAMGPWPCLGQPPPIATNNIEPILRRPEYAAADDDDAVWGLMLVMMVMMKWANYDDDDEYDGDNEYDDE